MILEEKNSPSPLGRRGMHFSAEPVHDNHIRPSLQFSKHCSKNSAIVLSQFSDQMRNPYHKILPPDSQVCSASLVRDVILHSSYRSSRNNGRAIPHVAKIDTQFLGPLHRDAYSSCSVS